MYHCLRASIGGWVVYEGSIRARVYVLREEGGVHNSLDHLAFLMPDCLENTIIPFDTWIVHRLKHRNALFSVRRTDRIARFYRLKKAPIPSVNSDEELEENPISFRSSSGEMASVAESYTVILEALPKRHGTKKRIPVGRRRAVALPREQLIANKRLDIAAKRRTQPIPQHSASNEILVPLPKDGGALLDLHREHDPGICLL